MRVFCTPLFSPSQYLSIVFSSSQPVISGQCIRSLQMSLGVFAPSTYESGTTMRVVLVKQHGHSLTACVKIQPSSLLCDGCT